jgi:hypothetical protein
MMGGTSTRLLAKRGPSGRGAATAPKARPNFAAPAGQNGQHVPREVLQRRQERGEMLDLLGMLSRLYGKKVALSLNGDASERTTSLVSRHLEELTEIAKSSKDSSVRAAAVFLISLPSPESNMPMQAARGNALRAIAGTSSYSDTRAFAMGKIREGIQ